MKIAIAGLGRMGVQIARKLAEGRHAVVVHNRSREPIDKVMAYGTKPAYAKQDVLQLFSGEQLVLWFMLPADVVDDQLNEWLAIVPTGSILIDGGNSDFRLTMKRAEQATDHGCVLVDVGTSGGVWGYQNGFSMMVGGDKSAYQTIEPALKTLSKPSGAYQYFGPNGAGHYVKMVHNAIEYGMMESLAEGYRMLREGPYQNIDLAAAGGVWQHGSVINSWLNELTRQVLTENSSLTGIDGIVSESGETRWTLETARELGIPLPAIQTSFDVRLASQKGQTNFSTKLLSAMRNKFGGHEVNPKD
ncbi:decarboxylating 6-phosphogluconate dehydrogenase [Candidatus Saccharibacteria bacterium]|nr:decarboxylating 6-phosphogluconate dehydrogenase [Candidatus Saccharibacteria bacterium]